MSPLSSRLPSPIVAAMASRSSPPPTATPPTAGVAGPNLRGGVVAGAVELVEARAHDGVIRRTHAEIDLRHVDAQRRLVGGGRDVLLDQLRQTLGGDLVDRADDHALTVGIDQVGVLPGARHLRQAGRIELARRQHHLLSTAVQVVAVDVDIRKLVVLADALQLIEGGHQRAPVGDAHVGQGRLIARQHAGVERAVAGQVAHVDPVEVHRVARGGDVVVDVRPFGGQLVGVDGDLLVQARPDFAEQEADGRATRSAQPRQ